MNAGKLRRCVNVKTVYKYHPMTAALLRQYLANAPVTLKLSSKRRVPIAHRDFVSVSPTGQFILVYKRYADRFVFEVIATDDILHVAEGRER